MSDTTATANAAAAAAAKSKAKAKLPTKKRVRLPVTIHTIEDGQPVAYQPGTPVLLDEAEADALIERYGEIKDDADKAADAE